MVFFVLLEVKEYLRNLSASQRWEYYDFEQMPSCRKYYFERYNPGLTLEFTQTKSVLEHLTLVGQFNPETNPIPALSNAARISTQRA
jgi:hypothetical protein